MSKPINLQLGWPSPSLLPNTALHAATTAALTNFSIASDAMTYGPFEGYPPLRESLATWLSRFYQPAAGPVAAERIYVGNGASATLGIILTKYTDPVATKRVFMIEPTYFLACPIFEDAGFEGRLRGIPEDEEGIDIGFLKKEFDRAEEEEEGQQHESGRLKSVAKYPKLYRYVIYAVPTFANPSAKVMSLRRRRELVQLARQYDALVVTDDVYDMLRWPVDPSVPVTDLPPPPPRLVDVDREMPGQTEYGNTASNGSFSKLVGPGTRISWVEGTAAFTLNLATHGPTRSGGSPGHLAGVFMDQMLRSGSLDKHIAEVLVPTYRKRYVVLMDAIEKDLGPFGVKVTTGQAYQHEQDGKDTTTAVHAASIAEAGGFFTYIALPDDLQPAEKVAKIALDRYALKFAHGAMMLATGDEGCLERAKTTFGRGARLSWAWHDEEQIREGIRRLAGVLADMRGGTVAEKGQNGEREGLGLQYT